MTRRVRQPLHDGWTLRQVRAAFGAPVLAPVAATVPGCVHTDLLAHGLIPDPFLDTNEAALTWVADSDWGYSCTVVVDDALVAHDVVELVFDGLDTLATVRLDGAVIGETENMHRRYRFDVSGLEPGEHVVDVVFRSATQHAEALVAAEGVWPSASFGRPFNHVRKMACSWGWDWGPWLTTAGVWRPAAIEAWSGGRLGDVRPHVRVTGGDALAGHGSIDVDVDVAMSAADAGMHVRARLLDPHGVVVVDAMEQVHGLGTVQIAIDVGTVARWWPHTHGDQPLYTLDVELVDGIDGAGVVDSASRRIGFRTIELDTSPDATGSAFTFVVNGTPIFVRGVNWIPDDVFPTRITADDYRERLGQAVDAHVDMIRVWGGGIYEDDRFYDLCDELGLLVWQDFLFACAAYPEHLLAEEVEAEARDNVSRLMHHASLAIWNGNNENIWGYWDWGWQEVLQGRTWGAGFYHGVLPRVCGELDPGRPYWPGSPWSGSDAVFPNADAQGCVHVWDVWNQLDLVRYRDHTPRFVSEFGWQAPPSMVTMAGAVSPGQMRRDSDAMRNHQKAADGDLKLDRGIVARFGEVTDLETFWYVAQVVQARAIRTGVEHYRSLRPYCMGTIWWQLNDCWPVASWAVVDGEGRPKPAWYALRDAYRPQLLTIQPRGDRLALIAVNDGPTPWRSETFVRRLSLDGEVLAESTVGVDVAPGGTWSLLLDPALARCADASREVLVAGDAAAPDGSGYTWWWYAADRDLVLPPPAFDVVAHDVDGGVAVALTSSVVVPDLAIHPERVRPSARADRQLITLHPGVTERIVLTGVTAADHDALLQRPACWSVHDALG